MAIAIDWLFLSMDPISHALFAKTLHTLDDRARLGRGAGLAFVVGGLIPDVDIVRVFQGWDVYLLHHEAGTHTIWATPLEGAVLAGLVAWLVHESRFLPLLLASTLGALSHVFLDFAGGSDMRVLVPVADVKAGWHLMAMWEPVVVLALVALHLPRWKQKRRLAIWFLVAFAGFLVTKAGSQQLALRAHGEALGEPLRLEEVRGSLTRWRWYRQTSDGYAVYDVLASGGAPRLEFTRGYREGGDTAGRERIEASRDYPVVRHLLHIGEMPLVWVEASATRRDVHWSDAQFCGRRGCALSFGVALDAAGAIRYQFVQLGGVRQTRPAVRQEGFVLSRIE